MSTSKSNNGVAPNPSRWLEPQFVEAESNAVEIESPNCAWALLCPNSRFAFSGECTVDVMQGQILVNGFKLSASSRGNTPRGSRSSTPSTNKSSVLLTSTRTSPLVTIYTTQDAEDSTVSHGKESFSADESDPVRTKAKAIAKAHAKAKAKGKSQSIRLPAELEGAIFLFATERKLSSISMVTAIRLRPACTPIRKFLSSFRQFRDIYGRGLGEQFQKRRRLSQTAIDLEAEREEDPIDSIRVFRELDPCGDTPFLVPPEWLNILAKLQSIITSTSRRQQQTTDDAQPLPPTPPVIMVVGGKNTGKSSAVQWTINRLLQTNEEVAVLDADIGQAEFTPAGQVSLSVVTEPVFGSAYTHLKTPLFARFVGANTPLQDPRGFLQSVFTMFDKYILACSTRSTPLPLVINSQGWVKGLGFLLLLDMIRYISPSVIFNIEAESAGRNIGTLSPLPTNSVYIGDAPSPSPFHRQIFTPLAAPHIFCVKTVADLSKTSLMDAKGLRAISLMIYLCNTGRASLLPVSMQLPYAVPWKSVSTQFIANDVAPNEMLRVLDASVVALLGKIDDPSEETSEDEGLQIERNLLGYAIIRAIDVKNQTFFVNTPVSPSLLPEVEVMMKGDGEVPSVMLIQGNHKSAPYLTYEFSSTQVTGGKVRKTRTNLVRKRKTAD
eukprot:m.76554 g.76554  ORF g.76554 m.76554 type:complete len:665 (-) comp24911_c0_seq1:46-2040(-)